MFDLSWGELLLVGAVALIVIGPRELPRVLRTVGQTLAKLRRMAGEFQSQFSAAMREAELDEIRQAVNKAQEKASSTINMDSSAVFRPLQTVRDELRGAIENKGADIQSASQSYSTNPEVDIAMGKKADISIAPVSPVPSVVKYSTHLHSLSNKASKKTGNAGGLIGKRHRKPPRVVIVSPSDAVKPLVRPNKGVPRLFKKIKFSPLPARNRRRVQTVKHNKQDDV